MMASMVSELSPYLQLTLVIIAGGGVAVSVQSLTTIARLTSSATTGGLGNPFLSTVETGGSTLLSIAAVFIPIVAFLFVLGLFYFIWKKVFTRFVKNPKRV